MTYIEIFKIKYLFAQELVRGWARTKINLDIHNKRTDRPFSSDQGNMVAFEQPKRDGQDESQLNSTALTEQIRALQIRLSQEGPSDQRHQTDDSRTIYQPQQPWGYQPLVHQAQGNTDMSRGIPRQGQLYDYETRQRRPYPN
ncbi:uncharacterized protein BCR38DRAFT_481978 [Pseudomassariella vexata]|uniref:Uncharacterized protein n=1 Tax=Pseudomassariella vexata TaxID=1141098 RepID=A0A1Y2EAA1_9PEZI|nr:uncharacterized protein BCR38DRAFT_481978 [Pseudomassariella vexata]ORY68491.1 hypothetical protein BCR38DRAFT_481978 [Pseudomassariella vexata]